MRENMLARNRGLATQVNNGPYTSYDPANGYVAPIGDGLTPLPPAHVHNGSIDYSAMGEGTEARTSMAGSDAPMMRQSAV